MSIQQIRRRLMSLSLKYLINSLLRMGAGALGCALTGYIIKAMGGITSGFGEFTKRWV
jgi:hypothetical protein